MMPLLGSAAMLLSFDVVPEAWPEHDDWHTHEHMPERLSVPGFLRGSRWVATRGNPRYLVLYEVAGIETLTSPAYLQRLNNPSAWTSRMMPHYRVMTRGLCSVPGSWGLGMGSLAHLVRFEPRGNTDGPLMRWLLEDIGPSIPATPGLVSAHVLKGAASAPMTDEQRIRGVDATVDCAFLSMGYEAQALERLSGTVGRDELVRRGATVAAEGLYRLEYVLTRAEV